MVLSYHSMGDSRGIRQCYGIMRTLWISRSPEPAIVSLSEFLLSLTTGIVLIVHYRYLAPLIAGSTSDIQTDTQAAILFVILVSAIKCLFLFCIFRGSIQVDSTKEGSLSRRNMVYPGLVKAGLSLSMIILVSGGRYLSLAIVAGSTLAFIGWLHLCSTENQVAKTVWRGRNYSANPIKICLLYLLTIIAVGLQPSSYSFSFQLHFEIFIIFIASLLIFSYFYLHRLVLSSCIRGRSHRLLAWEAFFELLSLLVFWLYLFFMEQDFSLDKQWDNLVNVLLNWGGVISVAILNTGFEMVLWEHIRKVALSQLAVSMATGFLWFNVYLMSVEGINLQLYISCMVMGAVLLTNIGLFSQGNFKKLQNVLNRKKPRKKKEGEGPTLTEDE